MSGSNWKLVPLREACAINPGLRNGPVPNVSTLVTFVPMSGVDETSGTIARPEERPYSEVCKGYTAFREGDILFAKITPCMENGKAAIADGLVNGVGCGSTEFHVLRPGPQVLGRWVFYFVRRDAFRSAAKSHFTGTAGQKRVPADFLQRVLIPVPPLGEQQRFVAILDEAAELQRLRREADRRTAELVPAIFDEMFGDPAANPKGWPRERLANLVQFVGGGTPARNRPEFFDGAIPWATSKDMKTNYLGDAKEHITKEAIQGSATNLVPPGAVLVVVKSKILARTLPVAIADVPICFGQDLKAIICGERLGPEYLASLLRGSAKAIIAQARGLNTEGLTLDILGSVSAPIPPLALQREFARRVEQLRAIEARQTESGQRLEALSRSLLERAFTGDLN